VALNMDRWGQLSLMRSRKVKSGQVGSSLVRLDQVRSDDVRLSQIRSYMVLSGQIRYGKDI
jgi:hypothetical protein